MKTVTDLVMSAFRRRDESAVDVVVVDVSGGDQVLDRPARGIYVGTAGDVKIETLAGNEVVIPGVLAGSYLPVGVVSVIQTGTTASGIRAFV